MLVIVPCLAFWRVSERSEYAAEPMDVGGEATQQCAIYAAIAMSRNAWFESLRQAPSEMASPYFR